MRSIVLRSPNGQRIELTTAPPPNPYVFVSLDGQGTADATLYTAQAVLQSGATALETLLEMRTLTVSLLVTGQTRQELDENLLALGRLVNPLLGPTEILVRRVSEANLEAEDAPKGTRRPEHRAAAGGTVRSWTTDSRRGRAPSTRGRGTW